MSFLTDSLELLMQKSEATMAVLNFQNKSLKGNGVYFN